MSNERKRSAVWVRFEVDLPTRETAEDALAGIVESCLEIQQPFLSTIQEESRRYGYRDLNQNDFDWDDFDIDFTDGKVGPT